MTKTERNLLYGVVSLILPENILDQFDIVKFEEEDIARNDGSYQPFKRNLHIYLDEQDNRTAEQCTTLKPNGFTEYISVKDYPVRNRPVTSRSVGRSHGIDGDYLGQVYKNHLSDYEHWDQKVHAKEWILMAKNMGRHLSIAKTAFPHAKISLDRFHMFQDLNKYFMKAFAEVRDNVLVAIKHEKAAFKRKVEQLARSRKRYRAKPPQTLQGKEAGRTIKEREGDLLNYYETFVTNASAESLNSGIKGFRTELHGISNLPFFFYRVCKIDG